MPSVSNNVNSQKPKTTYKDEYPCSSCKRILKSKLSLKKHLEMHHKKLEVESKYMCHICKRVFSQAYMLRDHLRSHSGKMTWML